MGNIAEVVDWFESAEFQPYLFEYTDEICLGKPASLLSENEFIKQYVDTFDNLPGHKDDDDGVDLMVRAAHQMTRHAATSGGKLGNDGPLEAFARVCYRALATAYELWGDGHFIHRDGD